jgi:hypothetical protein
VSTFGVRLSNVDEFTRKKQHLPSKNRLKKICVGWLGKIDILCNVPIFNPQINNVYRKKGVFPRAKGRNM